MWSSTGVGRGRPADPLAVRLARYINKSSSCWLWTGGLTEKGYPRLKINGRYQRVNRLVWAQQNGDAPHDQDVVTECGNRLCLRHLKLAPHAGQSKKLAA